MRITVAKIGKNETVAFAAAELKRLLGAMDQSLTVDIRRYESFDPEVKGVIWVGLDGSLKRSLDETVSIKVKDGDGIITGSNECAVLIGIYRFMFELGCRFIRPGMDGEKIPERSLSASDLTVDVFEAASYRHRSVCIEGSVSFDHVYNMIDWLPKVGMSGYFMQFFTPSTFFKRYYRRFYENEADRDFKNELTDDDVDAMWAVLEEEISKRALKFHAVGHGWTCVPFGIQASGWEEYTKEIPEETRQLFAELSGERKIHQNPLNTNLCYSNPVVQNRMTDAITEYCKTHPAVNYLHFWMADADNNHCECENCVKKLPSDFYVDMLNMLDKKLTAAGVDTKIVCLIYVDLLWEPQESKIENPDRFVLMFAPITRTYSAALNDFDKTQKVELAPYKRNDNKMPSSVAENVLRLKKWQETHLADDSFDFDYHLMWDFMLDAGGEDIARVAHTDIKNCDNLGINGYISCQLQRNAFPSPFAMTAIARTMWDSNTDLEALRRKVYAATFGEKAVDTLCEYFSTLSDCFKMGVIRDQVPYDSEEVKSDMKRAQKAMDDFKAVIDANLDKEDPCQKDSWMYLKHHREMYSLIAQSIYERLCANYEKANELKDKAIHYGFVHEDEVQPVLDTMFFSRMMNERINVANSELDPPPLF